SRRRHTRLVSDWSSDVCSSDLVGIADVDLRITGRGMRLKHHAKRVVKIDVFAIALGAEEIDGRVEARHPDGEMNVARVQRLVPKSGGAARRGRGWSAGGRRVVC